ncbi:MAG: hypothetical protein QMD05_10555 [Candidatus Brocadiaceae bacterium]|nr:hypothetical protein [Candidatus Brocadiaceae bacterium]
MRVVRQKVTGRIVYRADPEFAPGMGIKNALTMGHKESECEEVDITQAEWDAEIALRAKVARNNLITENKVIVALLLTLEEHFKLAEGTLKNAMESKLKDMK